MNLRAKWTQTILVVTLPILLVMLLLLPAHANTTSEFFAKLVEKAKAEGNTVSFANIEELGTDKISVKGFNLTDRSGDRSLLIETLELSGATSSEDAVYQFKGMSAKDVTLLIETLERDTSIKIDTLDADQFNLTFNQEGKTPFWPFDLNNGVATDIQILQKGDVSVSLNIPQIKISELNALGTRALSLGQFKMEASTGSLASASGTNSSFALGEINMTGFELFENAGYGIGAIEFGRFSLEGSDGKSRSVNFNFDGMLGTNLLNPDFTADLDELFTTDKLNWKMGAANFSIDGKDLFKMAGGSATGSYSPDTKDYMSDFRLDDIYLDLKAIGEVNNQEREMKPLLELGYERVTFDLSSDVSFNLQTGILNISSLRTDAEEMAAFDFSLKLGGYTLEAARKLQAISLRMNNATSELQQGLMFQMLAELSALELQEARIRIDDASLTKRLLEQQAGKSGQTAEDMVAAIPFMAGAILSQLDAPEFSASATTAVSAYMNSALKNSGSLVMQVKPQEPISFAELTGIVSAVQAGNIKPAELIERLNLTITGE